MVFLAITPTGLKEALRMALTCGSSVWCGADAVSEPEYEALAGADLSRFTYSLAGEPAAVLAGAVATIEEHHPHETVWVERGAGEP